MSLLGDEVSLIAIPLVAVVALNAGPAEMGLLAAVAGAPTLLFSLHLGAWLDRSDRSRESMVVADLGRAFLMASIPVAWIVGALSAWQLYAVAFLSGMLSITSSVAHSTVFVSLVPRARYLEANALLQGTRAIARAFGASIGGIVVQMLTAPVAVLVDALSFLASALFLTSMPANGNSRNRRRADGRHDEGGRVAPASQSVRGGLTWIAHDKTIRATLAAVATVNLFLFAFYALFVLYVTRSLRVPPEALGLVLGGAAIGGLAGSALANPISRRLGIGRAFAAGCVAFPAPLILVAAAPQTGPQLISIVLVFLAQLGSGFGLMLLDVTGGTIRAALIPDALRSRVGGAYMLVNKGARPLGSLLGGALGSFIGLRSTLLIAALGATIGVLWLLPSPLLNLRALPGEPSE